jgi:hypothetical protein
MTSVFLELLAYILAFRVKTVLNYFLPHKKMRKVIFLE